VLDGGGEFGVVVFGVVVFGAGAVVLGLVFGLVPLGFVWLGVSLGVCPFMFPLGLVVPGVVVFGFVVPGVLPVGGFTEPVGGGAVDPVVPAWPLWPAVPGAEPADPAPPGAACATIQVAQSKTTESRVRFLIMLKASRMNPRRLRDAGSPTWTVSLRNQWESIRRMP